jgi:ubiquinone biosynthesis protein UbiJ
MWLPGRPQQATTEAEPRASIAHLLVFVADAQQVGLASPDDVSVQEAIEANNAFVAALERIRDRAQTLTIK